MTLWKKQGRKRSKEMQKDAINKTVQKTESPISDSATELLSSLKKDMPEEEQALFDSLVGKHLRSTIGAKTGEEDAPKTCESPRQEIDESHIDALAAGLEKVHLGYGADDLLTALQEVTWPEIDETLKRHVSKFEPDFFEYLKTFGGALESAGEHDAARNLAYLYIKAKHIK